MIIDLILDRQENEKDIAAGYTHARNGYTGELIPLAYDPHKFYCDVMGYGDIGSDISAAMDYGTESDVKRALCEYITRNDYSPEICGFILSVNWLTA